MGGAAACACGPMPPSYIPLVQAKLRLAKNAILKYNVSIKNNETSSSGVLERIAFTG